MPGATWLSRNGLLVALNGLLQLFFLIVHTPMGQQQVSQMGHLVPQVPQIPDTCLVYGDGFPSHGLRWL